jgi:hypothetical protein
VLVLAGATLSHAKGPPAKALSVRELLALAPQAVAELADADRSAARAQLTVALAAQASALPPPQVMPASARLPPEVQLPLTPGVQRLLALDLARRSRKQDPLLVAMLLDSAVKPQAMPDLLDLERPASAASASLILPADLLPRDAEVLRRLCEHAAAIWPSLFDHATVRLLAGVPFAVVLSMPERVIYVNPVLLALVTPPRSASDGAAALPLDLERELTYRSVADCAAKLQAGCRACLAGDAARCTALRDTFSGLQCDALGGDSKHALELCIAHALRLPSVAACVTQADPSCLGSAPAASCRDRVDLCIANPDAGAARPDGTDSGGGALCTDCTCAACTACQGQCADSCGQTSRELSRPCGESCADKTGQVCTESCHDCNRSCQSSCEQLDRDFGCSKIGANCSQCSRDCANCNRQCNQCNGDCNRQCNQCNSNCAGCGSQCNQCGNDCNQCGSECNQCGNDCNQCGNECNQCNSQCNQCNGQCSVPAASGRYPRFPVPPGPAEPPPPLGRVLSGMRGGVMMALPPILFLWWRRRLHAERRQRAAPGTSA